MNLEIFNKFLQKNQSINDQLLKEKEIFEYFQSLKLNPLGWKISAETIMNDSINDEMIIFFCLQVIEDYLKQRYNNEPIDEQLILKQFLLQLFDINEQKLLTNYLQNKYAHLVNTIFLIDFPQKKWTTFFIDFLQRCNQPKKCELFLRILIQINIDIADREIPKSAKEMQRNTIIKDMMRESQCLIDLAKFWFQLINEYYKLSPQIIYLCLDIIGSYISWIDINLITNDTIMPILFMLYSQTEYRCSVVDCFQSILKKGMDPMMKTQLIEEFLNFNLIKTTIIEIFNCNNKQQDDDVIFIEKFSSLINTIGIELIESYKKYRQKLLQQQNNQSDQQLIIISKAIESKFQLLCQFLSHNNLNVSIRIHSFTRDYIQWLKSNIKDIDDQSLIDEQIKTLIQIIVDRNKYPQTTTTQYDDEFFNEYRKSTKILFDNLLLIKPILIMNFICEQIIIPTLLNWKSNQLTFTEIECSLYYFLLIGENINLLFNNCDNNDNGKIKYSIETLIQTLIQSSISMYNNEIIQSLYFDIIVRYEKYFTNTTNTPNIMNQLLSEIILSFLDERGLCNQNLQIRSKVCKLFNKFIKTYIIRTKHIVDIDDDNTKQEQFINDIMKRLENFLQLNIVYDSMDNLLVHQDLELLIQSKYLIQIEQIKFQYPLSTTDQLQIYEIFTFLIISNNYLLNEQKQQLLQELFQKIWNQYNDYYQKEIDHINLYLQQQQQQQQNGFHQEDEKSLIEKRTVHYYHMSHLIDLISATSKSFSNVNTIKAIGVQQLYLNSFKLFLKTISQSDQKTLTIIEHNILQSSIRLYLHRLIVCLSEDEMIPIIPDAIQTLFLSANEINCKSLQELIPLFNQIIPKYKHSWLFQRDISPFLDRIFSPLILLYFRLIIETNVDIDRLSLQKSYYSYLHLLTVHCLIPNFFDFDQQLIEKILTSLIEGIVHSTDSQIQRICCQVMNNIIDIYVNDMTILEKQNRTINQQLIRCLYDQLILACLICTAKNCNDDYSCSQDAILLLRKIKLLIGDEQLAAFLRQEIIPKYFSITNNNDNLNQLSNCCNNNNNNDDIIILLLTSDLKQCRKRIRHTFQQFKK